MTELAVDIDGQQADGSEPADTEDRPRSLRDNEIVDYITGEPIADTAKEKVRQRIGRALILEYGIDPDDMRRDFSVPVRTEDGKRRRLRADIVIFGHGEPQDPTHLRRVVICKPEPKNGNTVTKIRTPQQAQKDLSELKDLMGDEESPCRWGLWTNGVDLFFLEKRVGRLGPSFDWRADWPQAEESLGTRSVASHARLRRADADMLRTTFKRCHNFIHGNEGMPKDAAFWQFLYLLYAKMYDERTSSENGTPAQFYAGFDEPFTGDGQARIRERIDRLFAAVKNGNTLFSARDEIVLSNYALAFLVGELAPYDLSNTDIDAKGIAYQELVGVNLRGDRGQYFTPRQAVRLMVSILDPAEHETVLDPACGTGGFLRETLRHLHDEWRESDGVRRGEETDEQKQRYLRKSRKYAESHLYGADFDPFLVRATSMNIMMLTGSEGNVYHLDSLAFPRRDFPDVQKAEKAIPLGRKVNVLMTLVSTCTH